MEARPLVSIVVPSFNQGRYVAACIESCLAQDYRPIEILVMDGGSTDDTVTRLAAFDAPELRWWSEPDKGVVDAVNKAMALARGDILTIQSTDDAFLPGALTAAVQALQANPSAGLVYGDVELIDARSQSLGADEQGPFDLAQYLGRLQYIPQPGTCFTRAAMHAVGGWREAVSYAADADYWMRIAVRFPVLKLTRRVGRYRYHDEQRDKQKARILEDWIAAVQDPDLQRALTPAQRRHARMGAHLAAYRYAAQGAWLRRTLSLYAALAANPPALAHPRFPRRELLPGREPLWAFLSRVKRRLGFAPR